MKFSRKVSYHHNFNVIITLLQHYQCNNILLISNVNIIFLLYSILLLKIIKYVVFSFFTIFCVCANSSTGMLVIILRLCRNDFVC
jgi:hypothetical protein